MCFFSNPLREAVSNFLTALSLQRKSRNQQQVPHPAISGNIWAALRIALSLMDQPELFQAANLGDLDVLLRAFNLDPWKEKEKLVYPCNCMKMQHYFVMNFQKYKADVQKALVIQPAHSVLIQKHKPLYIESRWGLKEELRDSGQTKRK